jgi:hypothetical protein
MRFLFVAEWSSLLFLAGEWPESSCWNDQLCAMHCRVDEVRRVLYERVDEAIELDLLV